VDKWTGKFAGPLLPLLAAAGGGVLFFYAVRAVGVDAVASAIRRVGWGLVPILGLAGLRFMLRAQCWRLCMPAQARLPFGEALTSFLAGDAAGNVTPLGLAASEPTKVLLTRHRLATREAAASLAVDNLIYLASVITTVALGAVLMLITVPSLAAWRGVTIAAIAAALTAALAVPRLMRGVWSADEAARPAWRQRLAALREAVRHFSVAHPAQLASVYGIHLGFHALAMLEIYLTLYWLLGDVRPTAVQAIVFEALNRVLIVVFKFVPFRVGVDEAASVELGLLIGIPPAVAVAGAIVRKVRNLCWTGVGLLIIAAHRRRG
jgi:hypothetical protein